MSSLLEEWAEAEGHLAPPAWLPPPSGALADARDDALLLPEEEQSGAATPLFSIETLEKQASHGQGSITAVAAAANCVLLGTASGALIRYDFAEGAATGAWRGSEARQGAHSSV